MGAVRELFDGLGAAESVEVTEYSAERAGILHGPAPAPARHRHLHLHGTFTFAFA